MLNPEVRRGRGAPANARSTRFDDAAREADPDWLDDRATVDDGPPPLRTTVTRETPRTIISRNTSPDIPFDRSVNAYRGCEHGCIYCFARPTHAWLGLSPDSTSNRSSSPSRLRRGSSAPSSRSAATRRPCSRWGPTPTPISRSKRRTGSRARASKCCATFVTRYRSRPNRTASLPTSTCLPNSLPTGWSRWSFRSLPSTAPSPAPSNPARLPRPGGWRRSARWPTRRSDVGVGIADRAGDHRPRDRGDPCRRRRRGRGRRVRPAGAAAPRSRPLFRGWLDAHYPDRADHVMSLIRGMRGGRDNDPDFGTRMKGIGPYADLLHRRVALRQGAARPRPAPRAAANGSVQGAARAAV